MTENSRIIADRYKVLSEIGSGGMAIVFKVSDLTFEKVCALKTLKYQDADPKQLIRFQREAKAISSLRHPNIVSVLDFGVDKDNNPFLVMDYVEGSSLREHIKQYGPLPLEQALALFIQISDAIAYIHKNDILHRDLKSANIMVQKKKTKKKDDSTLTIQILDFGLAKDTLDNEGETLTKTGIAIGTPTYMSPEQAFGKGIDQRSEIYSLGCLFFEVLCGKVPFKGDTAHDTIRMHMNESPPSLNEASGIDFPPLMEGIVSRALKKEPEKRFQNVDQLRAELARLDDLLHPQFEETVSKPDRFSVKRLTKLGPAFFLPVLFLVFGGIVFVYLKASEKVIDTDKKVNFSERSTSDFNYVAEFDPVKWESSLVWHKRYHIGDEELLKLKPDCGIKNLSLYRETTFTTIGLKHVLSLPLEGIGLGITNLKREQLSLIAKERPDLKHLYLGGNDLLTSGDIKENVSKFKDIEFLGLSHSKITDPALSGLSKLNKLDTLKLGSSAKLHGTGFKYLKNLPKLRRLCLDSLKISKDGWKELSKLNQITTLNISYTFLDDDSIIYVSKMKNLKKLDVRGNPITDLGLAKLSQLQNLRILLTYGCVHLSPGAINKLRKQLPNCAILTEQQYSLHYSDSLLMTEKLGQ